MKRIRDDVVLHAASGDHAQKNETRVGDVTIFFFIL